VLDLGNAIYALTLRLLAQAWSARGVQPADKAVPAAALNAAMQLMRVLGGIGMHAGLTFTVPRATEPLVEMAELQWISERVAELLLGLKIVSALQTPLRRLLPLLEEIASTFAVWCGALIRISPVAVSDDTVTPHQPSIATIAISPHEAPVLGHNGEVHGV
jgi:hypothetical protein